MFFHGSQTFPFLSGDIPFEMWKFTMHVKGVNLIRIPFVILKLSKYKPDGNDSSSQVCDRSGIHNTINSHKYRKNQDQWQ